MVRTTRPEFCQAGGVVGIDEAENALIVLHGADQSFLLANLAAQPGQEPRQEFSADFRGQAGMLRSSEGPGMAPLFGIFPLDETRGPLNQVEGDLVTFPVVLGPIDQPML